MTILSILQIIVGIPLALFLPGYLLTRLAFREIDELEKIALGFVISIAIDIVLGLFLGYNKYMKNLTGGITTSNLWLYIGILTILLSITWIVKNNDEFKKLVHLTIRHHGKK